MPLQPTSAILRRMGFLRQLFGPSQAEVWRRLAEETGAGFVAGGFWRGSKVVVRVKEWTITLDTFTVSSGDSATSYTRLRAPYVNKDGFRFRIYRKSVFSGLGKLFGMQDIEVGYPEFDEPFRGNQGCGPAQVAVQDFRLDSSSALPPGLGLRERPGDPVEIAHAAGGHMAISRKELVLNVQSHCMTPTRSISNGLLAAILGAGAGAPVAGQFRQPRLPEGVITHRDLAYVANGHD